MRATPLIWFIHCVSLVATDVMEHPNWHLLDHETCGESMSDRIIGGERAYLGQYPWMARLGYIHPFRSVFSVDAVGGYKCGGSLINSLYVLTAAHCVVELQGDVLVAVRLGEYDVRTNIDCEFDKCAPPVQDFTPSKVVVHKGYQTPPLRHDIALIRLDRPAQISTYVSPICLPYGPLLTKDHRGSRMEVAGWGLTNVTAKKVSEVLMYVRVPVVNITRCQKLIGTQTTVGDGQLCAGAEEGHDSCGGDSGGPLMSPQVPNPEDYPRYFAIGLVSFGSVRCGSEAPAVYTDVGYYMEWILRNIAP